MAKALCLINPKAFGVHLIMEMHGNYLKEKINTEDHSIPILKERPLTHPCLHLMVVPEKYVLLEELEPIRHYKRLLRLTTRPILLWHALLQKQWRKSMALSKQKLKRAISK